MKRRTRAENILRNPVFKALGQRPVAAPVKTTLKLLALEALDATVSGQFHPDHRETIASVANQLSVLIPIHYGVEHHHMARAAQQAVLRADARNAAGKSWGFDGEGLMAVKDALQIYCQALDELSSADVAHAYTEVMRRYREGHIARIDDDTRTVQAKNSVGARGSSR